MSVTGREGGLYRATGVMTVGTALSRVTGLVRVAALAYALGVTGTRLADTYNLANTFPNILYELLLGGVFTAVFVPVIVRLRADRGADVSALVSVSIVALAAMTAITAAAAPLFVKIYTFRVPDPAARRAQEELATFLLRWFSPQILFYGLAAIAQALLNTRRRFAAPMFVPVLNNLTVVATFVAFARVFGEHGVHLSAGARTLLGAGTTAGVVVQALTLVPLLRGERLRFRPRLDDAAVRSVARLSGYLVGYVATNQLGLWVVLALANRRQGGLTAYTLAFIFFQLPHGLFAVSLITALQPELSASAGSGAWADYRAYFSTGVRGVIYLLLPAAAGYWILAGPITRIVLAHGVAGARDAAVVAAVLRAFATGLVFFSIFQLLRNAFNALHDTRTPFVVNVAATAVWIGVNIPLFSSLGVRGLAFGHAISYAFGAAVLGWALARRTGGLDARSLAAPVARIVLAAAGMGAGVWVLARFMRGGDVATVAVCVGAGAILYLAFSQVIGIPERRMLLATLRRGRGTGAGLVEG